MDFLFVSSNFSFNNNCLHYFMTNPEINRFLFCYKNIVGTHWIFNQIQDSIDVYLKSMYPPSKYLSGGIP